MKILLIEDNKALLESLRRQLSKTYVVDVAETGEDGLAQIRADSHDLVILDLNLPDKNGYEVCCAIRDAHIDVPILILTGANGVTNRVRLLHAGADDFLGKPFHFSELEARITALLRRSTATVEPNRKSLLHVRDLTIDMERRSVTRAGKNIDLRRKEFDILEYLVRNSGRTITRAMIIDHVWESGKDSWNNTVDVHIKHLRDKVDRPFDRPLIKTAYGIGYLVDDA
jgi:DNA-binding response OmpR family regulator